MLQHHCRNFANRHAFFLNVSAKISLSIIFFLTNPQGKKNSGLKTAHQKLVLQIMEKNIFLTEY